MSGSSPEGKRAVIRTGFSFKVAAGHLPDVMSRIKEIGLSKAVICDRNSTFGFNKWSKLCKKEGILPVYGVELAVTPEIGAKRPTVDYWKFLAKDSIRPLNELVALATSNPGKEPSLLYSQAHRAKGLFKITGERVMLDEVDEGDSDLFLGLSPALPKATFERAKKLGMNFCAVSDNVYPREEDREFYRVIMGSRANTQSYPQWIMSDEEWEASVKWFADEDSILAALESRDAILEECSAELRQATLVVPEKPKTLRQMCLDGAKRLKVEMNQVYTDRLERELKVIDEKKFEDYFYVLADVIMWAKERMIVGPARGSSCGSLVCYLLGITTIDPIPFDLIFERFIDITRADLPDVDVDFSDARRHLVFEYIEQKYGRERIARLGSVGQFKPRSALKQVGVALRIPSWQTEKVADGAVQRSFGDNRASFTIEDTLTGTPAGIAMIKEFPESIVVTKMEGHPSNAGQHAAGVVITQEPISEYVAVDSSTGAAMCDKKDAEDLGLLKIDALGLTQLSIFERTLELIGKPSISGYLETIPLDDPMAFEVLNRGDFSGIFQFQAATVQRITKMITVDHIEDLIAITALARPGPLGSGGTDEWIKRRNGAKVEYPDPILEPYLRDTLGIVIYQETVLKIGREIGGLSWADVTALRKAMSKSLGREFFDQYGEPWKKAAAEKGIPGPVLEKFWEDMCQFGAWAFNRAHSVAYGIVSYWCCWLKANHPLEFAAATLDMEADPNKQIQLLRELVKEGIEYVSVDSDHSIDKWVPVTIGNSRKLVGPLTNVEGIGPATVMEILDCRKNGKPLRGVVAKRLSGAKTPIDSLFPIADAVNRKYPDLDRDANIVTKPTPVAEVQAGLIGTVLVIVRIDSMNPSDENTLTKVQKRGGRTVSGPHMSLNVFASDDTGEMLCRVDRHDFERIGKPVWEEGGAGKALWAFKGTVPRSFRMLSVKQIKYLGRIDE
jgi:DNA polymerase III alpha subunit